MTFRSHRFIAVLAAAAVVLTVSATATATAAHAQGEVSTPAIIYNGNDTDIAVQGPDDSLVFYWVVDGTTDWHTETVAGDDTTYSAPSMILEGNDIDIAAEGAGGDLRFYWATIGTGTWHPETVGAGGSTFSAPSMIQQGGDIDIAVDRAVHITLGSSVQLRLNLSVYRLKLSRTVPSFSCQPCTVFTRRPSRWNGSVSEMATAASRDGALRMATPLPSHSSPSILAPDRNKLPFFSCASSQRMCSRIWGAR